MTNEQIESFKVVIEYFEDMEKKHYEECDTGTKANHIYNHILIAKSSLKALNNSI